MHNCKDAKEAVMEAALNGWLPPPDEFANCARCREEFDSLRAAMLVTDDALQLAQPRENYWLGYDARLRQRLTEGDQPLKRSRMNSFASLLRSVAIASIPVPAPLALVIFGFLVFSIFFLLQSRRTSNAAPPATSLPITRTIEVPVIQEKQVTRVVYRDRIVKPSAPANFARNSATAAIKRNKTSTENLQGFTPAHEARLTLIKGARDEK